MKFENLKVKEIINVLRHTPSTKGWHVKNRGTHIIGIQLRGRMYHSIGGKSITLSENSLFFFNQSEDFHAVVKELGESYTIHFTTWEPIETESFAVKVHSVVETVSILEMLERLRQARNKSENLAMSYFYRFCNLLEEAYAQSYHPSDARITDAGKYLELNFREKDALENAAKLSFLSRRRFNDLFKRQYGTTPNRYLLGVRIAAAKALLVEKGLSVKKIAELSGFDDAYYFSKVFKAEVGLSPAQFKKGSPM